MLELLSKLERKKEEIQLVSSEANRRNRKRKQTLSPYVRLLEDFRNGSVGVEELLVETEKVFNVKLPTSGVCPGHSAPGAYFVDAMSSKGENCIVWANRGGGKTQVGSLVTLVESCTYNNVGTRILGGSEEQSIRFYEHVKEFIYRGELTQLVDGDPLRTRVSFKNGSQTIILSASEKSVHGPHIPRIKLDEVDMFEQSIYESVKYMLSSTEELRACVHIFSTMNQSGGLFSRLVEDAIARGQKVYTWCIWDVAERCEGRDCDACVLWPDCQGIAQKSNGFFRIDDIITIRTSPDFDQDAWESQMLCKRPGARSLIWPQYDETVHLWRGKEEELQGKLVQVVAGVDWGYENPSAIVVVGRDAEGVLWVVEEFYKSHLLCDELADIAIRLQKKWHIERFFCDRTLPANLQVWRRKGLPVGKGMNDVEKRITLVSSRFQRLPPHYRPRIFVSERCVNLRREIKGYRRRGEGMKGVRGDKPKEEIVKKADHGPDSLAYGVAALDAMSGWGGY